MNYILFYLLISHYLFDFTLQNDATAINKNRHVKTELQKHVPWYYWMISHAMVHGGGVAFITGKPILGILETVCHFIIDCGKCEKWYSIHVDQFLHIACKVVWVIIYMKANNLW